MGALNILTTTHLFVKSIKTTADSYNKSSISALTTESAESPDSALNISGCSAPSLMLLDLHIPFTKLASISMLISPFSFLFICHSPAKKRFFQFWKRVLFNFFFILLFYNFLVQVLDRPYFVLFSLLIVTGIFSFHPLYRIVSHKVFNWNR